MPKYIDGVKRIKKRTAVGVAADKESPAKEAPTGEVFISENIVFDSVQNTKNKLFSSIKKRADAVSQRLKKRKTEGERAEEDKKEPDQESFVFTAGAEKTFTREKIKEGREREKIMEKQRRREREEEGRLMKAARDKNEREESQQLIIEQARKHKQKLKLRKERARRAKAKLRVERMAFKLKRKEELKKIKDKIKNKLLKKKKDFFTTFDKHSRKITAAGIVTAVIFLLALGALIYLVYSPQTQNEYTKLLAQKLNFPAIVVNYRPVSYSDYFNEFRLLGDYYLELAKQDSGSGEVEPNKDELVKEKIIVKSILDKLGQQYDLKIQQPDLDVAFNDLAGQEDGASGFIDKIYNEYGLTKDIFIDRVVYYKALREKVKERFISDQSLHKGVYLRLEKVQKLLDKNKDNFEEYAEKYSEDVHALKGGDIGYVRLDAMDDKLKEAVLGLRVGDFSPVIKEEGKYYIVKVYDVKDGRQGQEVWLKQITIFTNYSFEKYLEDLRKSAKVWNFIQN